MTVIRRKIFIDSSILIAFIDRGDPNHLKATKAIEDMAGIGCRLYTSSEVVSTSYGLLARTVGITVALEFLQAMTQSGIEILYPQKADLITSYRILKVHRDEKISLREAISATLMQKKGINQILTLAHWNNLFGTTVSNITSV